MQSEQWRVGDLVLDAGRLQVTRGDQPIKLTRLSFDLLLALARAAPNVLSNDDLMSEVWPGMVVSPETVAQRVKLLRNALGDRSAEPRYIASRRGSGYCLVADAVRIDGQSSSSQSDNGSTLPMEPVDTPARHRRRAMLATIIAGCMLLAGLLSYFVDYERVVDAGIEQQAQPTVPNTSQAERTVAVLPFKYLGPDQADDYLAQALSEIVLDRLATVQGLTVIARESALRARNETDDARRLGERLHAGYLVDGSIQREADRLRVAVRLVSSRDQVQLWSRSFDRPATALFALQDDIAGQLTETLRARISGLRPSSGEQRSTNSTDAYLAYLRGRTLMGRYTVTEALAAAEQFEKAIDYDAGFATAYAALFDARMQAASLQQEDLIQARLRYRPLLERALALDPESGAAAFAQAVWDDLWDEQREALFRKAIALEPGDSRALTVFAEFLDFADGNVDRRQPTYGFSAQWCFGTPTGCPPPNPAHLAEAEDLLERAIQIDPLSPRAYFKRIGRRWLMEGLAIEEPMRELLQMDPRFYPVLQRVGRSQWIVHDSPADGIVFMERAIAVDPPNPWARNIAAAIYLDLDDPEAAQEVANGAPASAVTASVALAAFAGDVHAAGVAALDEHIMTFGVYDSWESIPALRDAALQTRDFETAKRLLRSRFNIPANGPVKVSVINFKAYVALAHLELIQGHHQAARDMLRAVIGWIDANPQYGSVFRLRYRAEAQMLLGEREQALRDLKDAFVTDRDHVEWWYTLRRDPIWNAVRQTPDFQVIQADANAFLARERAKLEEFRRRGEVPRRPARNPDASGMASS